MIGFLVSRSARAGHNGRSAIRKHRGRQTNECESQAFLSRSIIVRPLYNDKKATRGPKRTANGFDADLYCSN